MAKEWNDGKLQISSHDIRYIKAEYKRNNIVPDGRDGYFKKLPIHLKSYHNLYKNAQKTKTMSKGASLEIQLEESSVPVADTQFEAIPIPVLVNDPNADYFRIQSDHILSMTTTIPALENSFDKSKVPKVNTISNSILGKPI